MTKKTLFFIINLILVYGLTSCNTLQYENKRKSASLESPEQLNNRFDDAFIAAFLESEKNDGLLSKVSATNPNSNALSNTVLNNHIKTALKAEFNLADPYQKVSDKTYNDCVEGRKTDPDFKCINIMDTDVYKKSMAIWMYSDYARGQAKNTYLRMLEMNGSLGDGSLIKRISEKVERSVNKVQEFARNFKDNFENGIKTNVERGFAHIKHPNGDVEYRRGAMNTLDYAAQAEFAEIINEVKREKNMTGLIDINLESLYLINSKSYTKEAETGDVQPEELEAFEDVIKKIMPTKEQRELADIGWHDVHGRTFQKGEFALTYDDGPKKSTTTKLLNYLGSPEVERALGYKPHATFFWQAINARLKSSKDIIAKAKRLGYSLSSHSFSHENFAGFTGFKKHGQIRKSYPVYNKKTKKYLRTAYLHQQLVESKEILESVYGTQLNYFRLPYASGRLFPEIQRQVRRNNMVHVFWNINADDWRWRKVSRATLARNYIREIDKAGRGVILLHDIHENTVGPLTQTIIRHFIRNKDRYRIVPLEKGIQETFVNIPANGRLPSTINRIAHQKVGKKKKINKPVKENTFPHFRKIIASNLNVRTGPSSSDPVCGIIRRNDQVRVLSQDSWFVIDNLFNAPDPLVDESFHSCGNFGYIHNGSNYSLKMK